MSKSKDKYRLDFSLTRLKLRGNCNGSTSNYNALLLIEIGSPESFFEPDLSKYP